MSPACCLPSRSRRPLAIFLVVSGGVLMLLSAEVWTGLIVFIIGVGAELAGFALEHRSRASPERKC
ncbi:MAG TPA: hypothetical protein DHV08_06390 [Rhodocyclaceae bacterium]|nr:MAG: hypothetical protein COW56_13880 [Rhodocyclales bacterium CG17_big_fil_post_rev_8_21_14_2_50_68_7]PIX76054.1 MAG: hypothetical protein COZ38_02345 [Rhodocyclales bacterium CG_4_10_14_3_um_filter_68_10]PJA58279.1 MAG: hypothetical protein CO164_03400 [Rhodocyclales bacterium CG_4_9_14_3_um_filter_68_10]HCX33207.1 hypothetical protein [Rhodocyclaceae bacterium]